MFYRLRCVYENVPKIPHLAFSSLMIPVIVSPGRTGTGVDSK